MTCTAGGVANNGVWEGELEKGDPGWETWDTR